jgi:Flp pilus assembly protein TadG
MRLTRCLFWDRVLFDLGNLRDDRRGTIAITFALGATVLFGFAGLAIDVASWQVAQLSIQGLTDAAAFSAAIEYSKNGGNFLLAQIQAQGIASQQGYTGSCSATVSGATVSVCVKQPPSTANDCTGNPGTAYAGTLTAIQVVICQPQARFFSVFFLMTDPTVKASAVALQVVPPTVPPTVQLAE